jgi:hypothetical protein
MTLIVNIPIPGGPQQLCGSGWAAGNCKETRQARGATDTAAGNLPRVWQHAIPPVHGPPSGHPERQLAKLM